ncbi:hypothetical protein J7E96_30725 [Streptomyces sp. ISL-96]|nr:hypothetical protein [Streptomyces sp. ISL-96]MBT2492808.1 hypothetical protein [Streptomyces sp. ISL-96]
MLADTDTRSDGGAEPARARPTVTAPIAVTLTTPTPDTYTPNWRAPASS